MTQWNSHVCSNWFSIPWIWKPEGKVYLSPHRCNDLHLHDYQWNLYQGRSGSTLTCVRLRGYLLPQGYHPCKKNYPDATRVVASQQEFRWLITKENQAELKSSPHAPAKFRYSDYPFSWSAMMNFRIRLSVPNSRKCLDLADYGRGCNAEVWSRSEDESQLWYFELLS